MSRSIPRGVARIADMGFVKLGSDIATLSDANLPAVMEMKNKDGSMGYGVLKSVSGDKAEVVVKSRTFKIGMEELGGMATGNAVIYCSDRLVDPTVMRDGDIMKHRGAEVAGLPEGAWVFRGEC